MNAPGCFVAVAVVTVSIAPAANAASVSKILEKEHVEYAYPHWSHDGDRILFESNETGTWQIYTMDADGGHIVQVTTGKSNSTFPDWSPDNSEICFVSDRDGNDEVYVMKSDSSDPRRLTDDPAREIHPFWTPDGKKILFNSSRGGHGDLDIYIMNPDGSSPTLLSHSRDEETCARLSPAGDRIVYLRNNDSGLDDVFLMKMSNGSVENLTHTPTADGWPCWTPSGKGIVFSGMKDGGYKLFHMNIETRELTQLTHPLLPAFDGRANISSDGTKIAFNRQVDGPKNTIGIYVLRLDQPLQ